MKALCFLNFLAKDEFSFSSSVNAITNKDDSLSYQVSILVLLEWRLNVLESIAVTAAIGLAVDFTLHYGINYRLSEEESRGHAAAFSLSRMAGPTLMAAITTGAAGAFMLPSSVLPYIQVNIEYIFARCLRAIMKTSRGFCKLAHYNEGKV